MWYVHWALLPVATKLSSVTKAKQINLIKYKFIIFTISIQTSCITKQSDRQIAFRREREKIKEKLWQITFTVLVPRIKKKNCKGT